jgi:glycosyltransferase involved in cell wall biosynthesis
MLTQEARILDRLPPLTASDAGQTAPAPALSVIITNYNYARYLPTAIENVLSQDEAIELIVVDDCSTDNSRDVIESYGDRLIPVLLPVNSGQGAGFNAGFAKAHGELVMFLDADDFLLPGAAKRILANRKPGVSLYLYPMRYTNPKAELGGIHPPRGFSKGDISAELRERGRYDGTITSGMVFDRARMERYMPMDAEAFRYGGDGHVAVAAPLYGAVSCEADVISAYRLHDAQHTRAGREALASRARWRIEHDHARYAVLRDHASRLNLPVGAALGESDSYHIKERLISLMYAPDLHPIPTDTIPDLLRRCRELTLSQGTGLFRRVRAARFTLLRYLPTGLRKQVFGYEVNPASRPAWFRSLVKFVRSLR